MSDTLTPINKPTTDLDAILRRVTENTLAKTIGTASPIESGTVQVSYGAGAGSVSGGSGTPAAPIAEDLQQKSNLANAIAAVNSQEETERLMTSMKVASPAVGRVERTHVFSAPTLMALTGMRKQIAKNSSQELFNEATLKIQLIPHGVENNPEDYLYMAAMFAELAERRYRETNGA